MSKKNTKPKVDKIDKMSDHQVGFISGLEIGRKEGRKQLQRELLDLLGAFDKFMGVAENDDD